MLNLNDLIAKGVLHSTKNNKVDYFLDGASTLLKMAEDIRSTNGQEDFIYLLGWHLDDELQLVPNDPRSNIKTLFKEASDRNVQIRAILWDQWGRQNTKEVQNITQLSNGAAILADNGDQTIGDPGFHHISLAGSHHQKVLIVKSSGNLVAFCGGVDINKDRVSVTSEKGTPFMDVHCRILGSIAFELANLFVTRWVSSPVSQNIDRAKGSLRYQSSNSPLRNPSGTINPLLVNKYSVGLLSTLNISDREQRHLIAKSRTLRTGIISAIYSATQYIYLEDQYVYSLEIADALTKVLPKIKYLLILMSHPDVMSGPPDLGHGRYLF